MIVVTIATVVMVMARVVNVGAMLMNDDRDFVMVHWE